MLTTFLPLQTVLFQFLFLLVAIAIEGYVLNWKLNLGRQTSIQYAISINLFSTIVGWLSFFFIQPHLPPALKAQMISYIFFDHFLNTPAATFNSLILSLGIIIFFAAFFIKYIGLDLLQFLLQTPVINESIIPVEPLRRNRYLRSRKEDPTRKEISKATVILIANAFSHTAILSLLILRSL